MSIELERATLPCGVCGAQVTELRRGRCWGCFTRWSEARPVGKGSLCCVCGERRRDNLRLIEIQARTLPCCHNCATAALRLAPAPTTIDGLRLTLRRERRDDDRRGESRDHRVFPRERRVGERRGPDQPERSDTDPHLSLADFEEVVIEIGEEDMEIVEQTTVRDRH